MKLVLTGASGFIGGSFLRALLHHGPQVDLVLLASSAGSVADLRARWPDVRVEPLTLDGGEVNGHEMKNADVVLHTGWSTVPSTAMLDPRADLLQNVEFGLELMDAAGRAGIGRFIFLSSGGMVYGDPLWSPMDENHPTRPVSAYGASKLCFEQYLRTRAAHFGYEWIILRPSNVYGNEAGATKPQGVIEHWLTRIGREQALEVWNGLQVRRDYLHIDDLVNVLMRVLDVPISETTLNVGTGVGTSLAELIEVLQKVTGRTVRVEQMGTPGQGSPANVLDTQRCRTMLDWRPAVELRTGIERLWPVLRDR